MGKANFTDDFKRDAVLQIGQHRIGGGGKLVGDLVLAGPAAPGDGEDERDVGRIDLLVLRDAHGPG